MEVWIISSADFVEKYVSATKEIVISAYLIGIFQFMGGGINFFVNKDMNFYVRSFISMCVFGAYTHYKHYLLANLIGVLCVVAAAKHKRFQFKSVKNLFNVLLVITII